MPTKPDQQLKIIYRAVDSLVPDPKNARKHPEAQIKQLRASIARYDVIRPILLKGDDKTIGAGNGIFEAAKLEGVTELPTITIRGLSDQEWRAYAIADNKLALNSEWNMEVLVAELNSLQGFGFDLGDMGFGDLELGTMGVSGFELEERLQAAEVTPEPPKKPVVRRGELWILGDHRLKIGDSTNPEDVTHLLAGAKPGLLVSDPPYGVSYDANWRNERVRADGSPSDGRAIGKVSNDHQSDWRAAWALFPGEVAYVWHADLHARQVVESLEAAKFVMRAQIIWAKTRFAIGRGDYHFQHEPCWYAVRKGKAGRWSGDRKQSTLWTINHIKSETGHSTQKPIECMRRPILNNSKPGDLVYDPFCGSGTTLIAAHMEKRRCLACELDPVYGQVIIERWQKFSGLKALREDGLSFDDLVAGREKPSGRKSGSAGSRAVEKSSTRSQRKGGKPRAAS